MICASAMPKVCVGLPGCLAMLVALIVDPSGAVLLVQPLDNNLTERGSYAKPSAGQTAAMPPSADLLRCVQSALQRFRFPPAAVGNDDNDELALPLHFESK